MNLWGDMPNRPAGLAKGPVAVALLIQAMQRE